MTYKRWQGLILIGVLAAVGIVSVAFSLWRGPLLTANQVFSGVRAMRHVEAQVAFGPRATGTQASLRTGNYILEQLERAGWRTEVQPFLYQGVEGRNLIGRAGSEGGPVFILGAHYDTRRVADQDANDPEQPVLGANDGASGVAVLLELARVLDIGLVQGEVWLVFFDAEDDGGLDSWDWIVGSQFFVSQLQVTPEYAVIVDMVGDASQDIYLEMNSDPTLQACLWNIADRLGYGEYFIAEYRHSMLDDHIPFLARGIPAVDMIDFDYPYWHTAQDTVDKVSPDSLERVGRVLETFLEEGGLCLVSSRQ
jgi:glutaminyl-peptide cyclotransferase